MISNRSDIIEIDKIISRLKQGLIGDHIEITTQAYKNLYNVGEDVVPRLLDELQRLNLEQIDRPEIVSLATDLALIFHNLNESISRDFINSVLGSKCDPVVRRVLSRC